VRELLARVARAEGALGAACLAGLLACGLILIAILTREDSQTDRRSKAAKIHTLAAGDRDLGRVIVAAGQNETGSDLGLEPLRRVARADSSWTGCA
jgi:hypothetical protein